MSRVDQLRRCGGSDAAASLLIGLTRGRGSKACEPTEQPTCQQAHCVEWREVAITSFRDARFCDHARMSFLIPPLRSSWIPYRLQFMPYGLYKHAHAQIRATHHPCPGRLHQPAGARSRGRRGRSAVRREDQEMGAGRVRDAEAIKDVRESQFVDDEYVVATLGGVMDDMQLHLAEIERYQPMTPAVTKVHDRYRQAWRDLHDSFNAVITAMERKDYVALSKGTESLRTSRQELLLVAAAIDILMEDSGLKKTDGGGQPASS